MQKTFLLGIAGGSASGKTFLAEALLERFADCKAEAIHTDVFFRPEKPRAFSRFSGRELEDFNQPASWDLDAYHAELARAAAVQPDLIIAEGVFALVEPSIREAFDLTVFVDTRSDERFYRRLKRRMAQGVSLEEEADYFLGIQRWRHDEFYEPLREFCDLIVNGGEISARKVDVIEACIRSGLRRDNPQTGR